MSCRPSHPSRSSLCKTLVRISGPSFRLSSRHFVVVCQLWSLTWEPSSLGNRWSAATQLSRSSVVLHGLQPIFHRSLRATHAIELRAALYATSTTMAIRSPTYMVRIETLINPVSRFAARKTARPFLLRASSSGGTALPPEGNRLISITR